MADQNPISVSVKLRVLEDNKPNMDVGSKSKNGLKRSIEGQTKSTPKLMEESYEDEADKYGNTLCRSCGGNYNTDKFCICCDDVKGPSFFERVKEEVEAMVNVVTPKRS